MLDKTITQFENGLATDTSPVVQGEGKLPKAVDVIAERLQELVRQASELGLSPEAIRSSATKVLGELDSEAPGSRSQATKLLKLVESLDGIEIFKTPSGEAFVTFQPKREQELRVTVPAHDQMFYSFLGNAYLDTLKNLCSRDAIRTVVDHLSGNAASIKQVCVRIGHHADRIYVDLANDSEKPFVEISDNGWNLTAKTPIPFWRPVGLSAMSTPVRGGNLDCLRSFINADDAGFKRVLAFLLAAFSNGPQLVLLIIGAKGTAKTTCSRIIRLLFDPSAAGETGPPEDDRNLFLSCRHQALVVIDNVSSISPSRSNIHCTIATGAARRERMLYTNNQEFIFAFRRPQIISSIKDVITQSDLADRKLKIELIKISSEKRKSEKQIYEELDKKMPEILGAVYSAVAGAMAELPHVINEPLPRMADAAQFLFAIERHLHWTPGTIKKMFADEIADDAADAIETSAFASLLLKAIPSETNEWLNVSAAEVIYRLKKLATEDQKQSLPSSAKALGDKLRSLMSELEIVGFTFWKSSDGKKRCWNFRWNKKRHDEVSNVSKRHHTATENVFAYDTSKTFSKTGSVKDASYAILAPSENKESEHMQSSQAPSD
jgi:hypothetical protein